MRNQNKKDNNIIGAGLCSAHKNNKGITLVALVVTVIVLIILAAVTINLLIGTNGIITRAQEGRENYIRAEENEQAGLLELEKEIDKLAFGLPPIPEGFTHMEGTVEEGFVIKRITGDDESEFVWVPVSFPVLEIPTGLTEAQIKELIDAQIALGNYPMATKVEGQTDYRGVFYDFTLDTSVTPNKIKVAAKIYSSTEFREPAYLTDTDNGDANSTNNTVGITQSSLQTEYNDMITSVMANGGFYIGRYETSIRTGNTVQSKAGVTPMTAATSSGNMWWGMYAKQKAYAGDNGIADATSSMIWGSQWDQVLIWMKGVGNPYAPSGNLFYILDSIGMGNYSGTTGLDTWSSTSSAANTGCISVKNIYDMAGNVREWTMEAYYNANRTFRRRVVLHRLAFFGGES